MPPGAACACACCSTTSTRAARTSCSRGLAARPTSSCACSTRCRARGQRRLRAWLARCTSSAASTGACTTSCSSPTTACHHRRAQHRRRLLHAQRAAANFIDMDVLVSGPGGARLSASFDDFWNSEHRLPARQPGGLCCWTRRAGRERLEQLLQPRSGAPPAPKRRSTCSASRPWARSSSRPGRVDQDLGRHAGAVPTFSEKVTPSDDAEASYADSVTQRAGGDARRCPHRGRSWCRRTSFPANTAIEF